MRGDDIKRSIFLGAFIWTTLSAISILPVPALAHQALSSLQITTPADGAIINPGQTVTVVVTLAQAASFPHGVAVIGVGPLGAAGPITSPPYQFSLKIAPTADIGKFRLTAFGSDADGNLISSPSITLDVERPDAPTQLSVQPTKIPFDSIAQNMQLMVMGTFSDGSVIDVTHSSKVLFSSQNTGIATVDGQGVVTAQGSGNTFVTATFGQAFQGLNVTAGVSVVAGVVSMSPQSLIFAPQSVGTTSSTQTVILTNSGTSPLRILNVSATGDFTEADNCPSGSPLAVGGTCNLIVTFAPSYPGLRSGALLVTSNLSVIPVGANLTGTSVGPVASLSASSISFPGQIVGTISAEQSVTLNNTGNANLTISGISITGTNSSDFTIASRGSCPSLGGTLNAGARCTIIVVFGPATVGNRSATLSISDSALGSPQSISLTGRATDFSLGAASGGSTSATVTAGQSAAFNLQVNPVSGFAGQVSLSCLGTPPQSSCTLSQSSVNVSGVSVAFAVNVSTTANSRALRSPRFFPQHLVRILPVWRTAIILFWVVSVGFALGRRDARRAVLAFIGLCLMSASLVSCTSGRNSGTTSPTSQSGTPAGNYTLTISGVSGTATHTTSLALKVQ